MLKKRKRTGFHLKGSQLWKTRQYEPEANGKHWHPSSCVYAGKAELRACPVLHTEVWLEDSLALQDPEGGTPAIVRDLALSCSPPPK